MTCILKIPCLHTLVFFPLLYVAVDHIPNYSWWSFIFITHLTPSLKFLRAFTMNKISALEKQQKEICIVSVFRKKEVTYHIPSKMELSLFYFLCSPSSSYWTAPREAYCLYPSNQNLHLLHVQHLQYKTCKYKLPTLTQYLVLTRRKADYFVLNFNRLTALKISKLSDNISTLEC